MARKRQSARTPTPQPAAGAGSEGASDFTGKYLVLFRDAENGISKGLEAIENATGLKKKDACKARDFGESAIDMAQASAANIVVLDELKLAVVNADPAQMTGLQAAAADDEAVLAMEPEQIMYALGDSPASFPFEYLRGYKAAVDNLYAQLVEGGAAEVEAAAAAANFADDAQFTWGLRATRVDQSRFSGRGVRIAVLDTGFDLDHPDFVGRTVSSQSFVQGQTVQDNHGHGTHCIGTAAGFQQAAGGVRRYGCAFRSEIFAGKVLSNQGSGADSGILAGINWAITRGCRVISMSLGSRVQLGDTFSTIYETVAQRALRSNPGTLIVAAAGNESRNPATGGRFEPPVPVGRPANCPSILAVAALDSRLRVAAFSNGGINLNGGGVDIAAPGVGTFSSVPDPFPGGVQPVGGGRPWPARYHSIDGTSMATPHVAGIAAMWLEARGLDTSADALWRLLTGNARRLSLQSRDVGAGIVQAPI